METHKQMMERLKKEHARKVADYCIEHPNDTWVDYGMDIFYGGYEE